MLDGLNQVEGEITGEDVEGWAAWAGDQGTVARVPKLLP